MARRNKRSKRRISWLPTFFSITLVLFLAGLFGIILLNANTLKENIKQTVKLSVYFRDYVNEADIIRVQKQMAQEPFVLESKFISKEEGKEILKQELGDSSLEILGFNPVPNSIDITFRASFVQPDSLEMFSAQIEKNPDVREVEYSSIVVRNIDRNIRLAGIVLLSLAALMSLVSIALIYNTIRLTLYSKRFIIKSMQLVGATQSFIRGPFIGRGFALGLGSGVLACLLLGITLYTIVHKYPDFEAIQNYEHTAILFFGITLLGIIISGLSSYFAVSKYLKMKLDDLF